MQERRHDRQPRGRSGGRTADRRRHRLPDTAEEERDRLLRMQRLLRVLQELRRGMRLPREEGLIVLLRKQRPKGLFPLVSTLLRVYAPHSPKRMITTLISHQELDSPHEIPLPPVRVHLRRGEGGREVRRPPRRLVLPRLRRAQRGVRTRRGVNPQVPSMRMSCVF